jgi:hypothetical protein
MRRTPSARVATAGVTRTKLVIEDELGWLFREQSTEDYGIDAYAEVLDGEDVRGRLLALQIKSGKSWFDEQAPVGWWFRPDSEQVAIAASSGNTSATRSTAGSNSPSSSPP